MKAPVLGLVLGLVCGLAGDMTAQRGVARAEPALGPMLTVHHSFPEAGGVLRLVVEGFWPESPVEVLLSSPATAPPSVLKALDDPGTFFHFPDETVEMLHRGTVADSYGRVTLAIALDDPEDVERSFDLVFQDAEGRRSPPTRLMVQPPTLLLPARDHVVRIDLRDGSVMHPPIPGAGGLLAAAYSTDGFFRYLLRSGGRLETWPTRHWDGQPSLVTYIDPASDDLAHTGLTGPAFTVTRPQGAPFTPPGRLSFLDGREDLVLDPMAREMSGRRWAIAEDGTTAFVAEDELLVREIDVLTGTARSMFTAGLPGDQVIADLMLEGRRLYIASRRADGRAGSLSVLHLDTGWLSPFELTIDPQRLVALGDGRLLVVPAVDAAEVANSLVLVEEGIPTVSDSLTRPGRILDVAPVPGGALVLVRSEDSYRLESWDAGYGLSAWLPVVPQASRLIAAGPDAVLLLGASNGAVHRLSVETGTIEQLEGVTTSGLPLFAVIP
ncbi:MAG: hypothetical protein P8N09_03585 [Planctomycetota bacterium]|nr:hypothetical protein [Planctomycetota bacterium]